MLSFSKRFSCWSWASFKPSLSLSLQKLANDKWPPRVVMRTNYMETIERFAKQESQFKQLQISPYQKSDVKCPIWRFPSPSPHLTLRSSRCFCFASHHSPKFPINLWHHHATISSQPLPAGQLQRLMPCLSPSTAASWSGCSANFPSA